MTRVSCWPLVAPALLLLALLSCAPASAVMTIKSDAAVPLSTYFQHPPPPPVENGDSFDDDSFDDDDSDDDGDDERSHQTWERVWTIGTHAVVGQDAPDEVDEVLVTIPGRVFISTAAASSSGWSWSAPPLATVRFSGDSEHILDQFEVVSNARGVLEIRQRVATTAKTRFKGYLLVEVTLAHAETLKRVACKSSGQVVVNSHVLVTDAPSEEVAISVNGSGDVLVHDTPSLNVQSVVLAVSGSGDIELSTAQIEAKTLTVAVSGSGDVRLFANTVKVKDSTVAVAGSGSVYVNSYNFNSASVMVAVAGSGDVSVYPIGTCTQEVVAIEGSGDVYVGSLVCESVTVKIAGSGDAIVQATQSIDGGVVGSGDVKYVGAAPRSIAPKTSIFSKSSKKDPKPMAVATTHNKFSEAKMSTLPERVPMRLSVRKVTVFSDRSVLVPLVIVALLAAWYIHFENKKQNARAPREELRPLAPGQSQVYV